MPANVFGSSWAKEKFGNNWRRATCEGVIKAFQPTGAEGVGGKASREALWVVDFGEEEEHRLNWAGVLKNAKAEEIARRLQAAASVQGAAAGSDQQGEAANTPAAAVLVSTASLYSKLPL
jgi:hypothetical protein